MRSYFSTLLLLFLALSLTSAAVAQDTTTTLPNGVASGDVTENGVVLWTHSTALGTVKFEYSTDADFATIISSTTAEVTDPLVPVKAPVSYLNPATQYYYRVTDAAGTVGTGKFRTPAIAGQHLGLRFGVSGDERGELAPFVSIANAPGRDLDLFVEFGDTIYADYPTPALNKRQAETLEDFHIKNNEVYSTRYGMNIQADLRSSTPVLSVIDDHEVSNDFAGGEPPGDDSRFTDVGSAQFINETPLFKNGMQAFQEYNPIADEFYGDTGDPRTANKQKLYRYRTYGSDAAFFLLDERSFRDEELAPPSAITSEAVQDYLRRAFQPGRTMLGAAQLADLKADLLKAQATSITWKFILVPEPIQNLGPTASGDRYEGYAAERTELLKYIVDNHISNVVFISADFHSTLINNVNYQDAPGGPQIPTGTFEIVTGPIAFDAPFGPSIFRLANGAGLLSDQQLAAYMNMPAATRELLLTQIVNAQLKPYGYDPLGLDGSDIDATLLQGGWTDTSSYGWTEFDIDAATQQLHITVYGIPFYTQAQLEADPAAITGQTPAVMTEFTVNPK